MISKLAAIAHKNDRLILGLMSGTSLDGLDMALCQLQGTGKQTKLKVQHFKTVHYTPEIRSDIQEIFAKPRVDMRKLSTMNALIGTLFAECVLLALDEWGINSAEVDLIASHGQTIYHAPQSLTNDNTYPNSTFQIGDGDHIAVKTGIITVSDFRQKHVAAGGEGAPLVVYGDQLLFSHETKHRILLNIGGIANFTYLPSHTDFNSSLLATDTGPGNTLMNQYMQMHFDEPFDQDGKLAASGRINVPLLNALLDNTFFSLPLPKTTGPELFNLAYLEAAKKQANLKALSPQDIMATLSAFTTETIAKAVNKIANSTSVNEIYISGGGVHNLNLVQRLKAALPGFSLYAFDTLGLSADAKEAALFALLANETVAGNANNMNGGKNAPHVCLGKISLPK